MIEAIFGSPDQTNGPSLLFDRPTRSYSANQLSDVIPLLKKAEMAAQSGSWVALFLSYEAAPAFDVALKTHDSGLLPLAWAAEFAAPSSIKTEPNGGAYKLTDWEPQISRSTYRDSVSRISDAITRGDTYQVNYTFHLVSNFLGDPRSCYRHLCRAQESKHSVYLDLGRHKILCLSPELFFQRRADEIETRPMKGTIKRGRSQEEDLAMATALAESEKERAENVMIVDLLRNDLGKVCLPGSVKVPRLFEVERFPTLWQMTSTVKANVRRDVDLAGLMAALFPCGSITGAPKIRTMEIIRELESLPRGVYTGTIGLIQPGGDCIFNVAIRTIVIDSQTGIATFGVGGGITIDSTAEREYEECLLKTSFLNTSVAPFRLLESILLEDGEFFLLDRHLDRLSASAEYFGFSFSEGRAMEELRRAAANCATGKWKIRLLLGKNGDTGTDSVPLELHNQQLLRVGLALEPVDSGDRFLFHKTTNRVVYQRALQGRPDCDDVILWNERGEITESTVSNVVVSLDGELYTPAQESGLLAGTFRAELLEAAKIRERVIYTAEIKRAEKLFLINSVRKWREAVLDRR